jgi:antitoxin component YwqK of YwqJK toxin-antitoxin module
MKNLTLIFILSIFSLSKAQNSARMHATYSTVQYYNYELEKYEKAIAKQSIIDFDYDGKIYVTDTISKFQTIYYIKGENSTDEYLLFDCYDSISNLSCWINVFAEDSFYVCEFESPNTYKFRCLLLKNNPNPKFTALTPANNYNGFWEIIANDQLISKEKYKNGSKNGKAITYYENGKPIGIFNNKNGKLNGQFKIYFQNGKLKRTGHFLNDELNGSVTNFNENKETISIENFKMGKRNGEYKEFYANGKLKVSDNFKNDLRDGKLMEYYENGKLKISFNFKDGLTEGTCISYYKNGNKLDEAFCSKGIISGRFTKFYENGNIQYSGIYNDTILNGDYKSYYENGQVYEAANYTNGVITGIYNSYTISGKPLMIGSYINDSFSGEIFEYYENENIKQKNNYRNDTLNGAYIINYENGKVMESGQYKSDKKNGLITSYDSDGKIKSESFFKVMNGYNKKINYNTNGEANKPSDFYLNHYYETQDFDSTTMTFLLPVKMPSFQLIIDTISKEIIIGDSINFSTYSKFIIKSLMISDSVKKFVGESVKTKKTYDIIFYENEKYSFVEINYSEKKRNKYLSLKSNL